MARKSNSIWVYVRTGSPGSCCGRASPGVVLTEEFALSQKLPGKHSAANTFQSRATSSQAFLEEAAAHRSQGLRVALMTRLALQSDFCHIYSI
ncbi:hypothetical protein EYF80_006139 [Liparis tanakae]|uniref:Uncharacterized protein n=1 Tax=Liparis tanakae TaxID=230148 RepID=A0A4Z2J101_9TELE|nr:hypothetical protein EYF80_006139 [Liparis tanakae]